ncbi:MAG: hypothetical protein GY868_03860 [Deltaproteobacteria bacterium]|nr:hypothetical protein [Deltaproteobacteria bacterium]
MLVVDAGNVFLNTGLMHMIRSEYLIEAMGLMGYDYLNLSNWDFIFGTNLLTGYCRQFGVPTISANIVYADSSTPLTTTSDIRKYGDLTVGIIGIVAREYEHILAELTESQSRPLTIQDETEALEHELALIRDEADLVVVLANVGLKRAEALARSVSGLDVIVCGHGREITKKPLLINGVHIVKSGYSGQHIGRLTLTLNSDRQIAAAESEIKVLNKLIAEDNELLQLMDRFHLRLQDYQNELIKKEPVEPEAGWYYTGATPCAYCHVPQSGHWRRTGHARAWAALATRNQHYNPDCISCHITGYGYDGGFYLPAVNPDMGNVQCEMCHGPGGEHVETQSIPYGDVSQTVCEECHTEEHSPNFAYDSYHAKIAH